MAIHNELGNFGEGIAAAYLRDCGFNILHENWRHGRFEIDIIAVHENILHFVEVKTRSSTRYGFPEQSVTIRKLKKLIRASGRYLYRNPGWTRIQYDIVAVECYAGKAPECRLFTDVYAYG